MERIFPGLGAGPLALFGAATVLGPLTVDTVRVPPTFGPELKEVLTSFAQGDLVSSSCRSSWVQSPGFFSFQNSLESKAQAGVQAAAAAFNPNRMAVRRVMEVFSK